MKYETTKVQNNIKDITKSEANKLLAAQSTSAILWFLAKRHKTGLFATWAIVMTILYLLPFLPDLVFTVFR